MDKNLTFGSRVLFLLALASPVGGAVAGQAATSRGGAWITIALSYGSAHFFCDTCQSHSHADGMDLMVAIGGTPSSHWRAAAALEVWEHWFPGGDTLKETTNGTVSFYYYPLARAGFFLEGGFGL